MYFFRFISCFCILPMFFIVITIIRLKLSRIISEDRWQYCSVSVWELFIFFIVAVFTTIKFFIISDIKWASGKMNMDLTWNWPFKTSIRSMQITHHDTILCDNAWDALENDAFKFYGNCHCFIIFVCIRWEHLLISLCVPCQVVSWSYYCQSNRFISIHLRKTITKIVLCTCMLCYLSVVYSFGCTPGNKTEFLESATLTEEEFQERPIINWDAILYVSRPTELWAVQLVLALISLTEAMLITYLGYKVSVLNYSFLDSFNV